MLHIVLYEPEIPPNTGNLIRLCANTGARLHLIEPLGFSLDTKALRRAGLDYHEAARLVCHNSIEDCFAALAAKRWFAVSTRGENIYSSQHYTADDVLLFGPETRGLPDSVMNDERITARIRLPMQADSRSLNLANAVSIVVYEAWRQLDFIGGQ